MGELWSLVLFLAYLHLCRAVGHCSPHPLLCALGQVSGHFGLSFSDSFSKQRTHQPQPL